LSIGQVSMPVGARHALCLRLNQELDEAAQKADG
jgi:hypothetical protein